MISKRMPFKHMMVAITLGAATLLPTTLVSQTMQIPPYAEDYEQITTDGAWCWFSDPRAIYVNDLIIGGYVDKEGSIWSFSYDPETQEKQQFKLFDKLDYDDHANPSFLKLDDNRIVSFFSGHGGTTNTPIYYRVTERPGDITAWGPLQQVSPKIEGPMGYCYSNAAQLSAENNRIYLYFRGCNFKPNFITTNDLKTWSEPVTFVQDDSTNFNVRPYMKATNNGKDKIFFAFTDNHPRNCPTNSIYYAVYKDGKYYKANGSVISDMEKGSVTPGQCDKVYDASIKMEKAWIWDIAYDDKENPVIVYARFSSVLPEHSYWYARWNGNTWENHLITKAGQWFQRNDYNKNNIEYECNYSGGVYLDHQNPDIVYLSRPINDIFEIERWETADNGQHWKTRAITEQSEKDNVRPFVIRDHKNDQPEVLWMYNYQYPNFRAYNSAIRINQKAKTASAALNKEDVSAIARKVADWQIEAFPSNKYAKESKGWIAGALYMGMFDWAELSGDEQYTNWLKKIFNRQQWQVGDYMYHADDVCVAQTYLDMYARYKEKKMITPTLARIDWVIDHPSKGSLDIDYSKPETYERWSWCDALFMAPAVYTRLYSLTGDKKYIRFADKEFKATYSHLYDKEEHLFFRDSRYFGKTEANGKKVFWGRGNGWVIGGIAEILKTLPESDSKYRPFYLSLFKEISERLAGLQNEDGFWHASLLDPESYPSPETSATGFIVYGLAYGINQGYLPADKYLPVVEKGWQALVSSVDTNGKLGWVQPVGADPRKVTKNMTELYGTGAFLMAACEIYKINK